MESLLDDVTHEPLPEGEYYLVDISTAVEQYLKVPRDVRLISTEHARTFSELDMLDVELSALVPCLEVNAKVPESLIEHSQTLLEDYSDMNRDALQQQGVDVTGRTIPHTAKQLQHADVVHELGASIHRAFLDAGVYTERGDLPGEHCSLLHGNVLVLRSHHSKPLR